MNTTEEVRLALEPTTSEMIEMFYQLSFFLIGTPINLYALFKTSRSVREGGVESRLVKLSRQLLIAHLMVLFIYGVWRSYWFYNIAWVQGDLLCKLFSFFCALPFHLWSNMVAAIAVDMLFCITSPLSSYRTGGHRVTWLIGLAWVFAIICALPMLFIRGTVSISSNNDEKLEQCYSLFEKYSKDVLIAFNIFHVITTFYVPLLIVVICYTIIGFSIRKQMAERKLLQDAGQNQKQSNTKARFLRASVAIIATFFFTWLPYQVLALLRVVCDQNATCQEVTAKLNWLQAIIIASTCINPFLYRFGAERGQRSSHFCSTIDTGVGKEVEAEPRSDRRRCGVVVGRRYLRLAPEERSNRVALATRCGTTSEASNGLNLQRATKFDPPIVPNFHSQ